VSMTEATVMNGETAEIGSRVKHYGQRYTGCATATVVGFSEETFDDLTGAQKAVYDGHPGVKVYVEPVSEGDVYGSVWDWDRTELAPDL
jgi:protein-disulfide isomerase-like protein with CxxC motif